MRKIKTLTAVLAMIICALLYILPTSAALIGGDGGFYYSLKSDSTATLEEFHGSAEDIVIPSDVYSYKVTAIAENTFSNNTTIKSVVIPNSVNTLGAYAFYGCTSLERATLPGSITSINAATFYGCASLTEVTIPASVTKIAANAFNGCEELTIKGDKNTAAETYAQENGFNFVDLHPAILGDVDHDGTVTSADALSVLRMSAGLEEYTPEIVPFADIDGDENITSGDALGLLRFSASLPANERIGQPI